MAETLSSDIKKDFNKRFGEGTFFTFSDTESVKVQPVPTGIPGLDYALGIGGLPAGRIVELYGPESSGKTTVALHVIAEFQKLAKQIGHPFYGKKAAFIDAEHALDPLHVAALGVDVSEETGMLINQPDYGEQAYDICEALCLSGQIGIIVVDSVAALVPKKEIEGSTEDNFVGLAARMNAQGLRKLNSAAAKNNVLVIFINQIREKVGVMFGNPETTPGGRALKFFSSVRMEVRRKEIKQKDVVIGQTINISIKKNKVSRPFTTASFDYYFDTGIDVVKDIMNVACDMDIIHRKGAYYFLGPDSNDAKNVFTDGAGNELKWQGKDTLEAVLKQSPELFNYINDMVQGRIPKDAQFVQEESEENGEGEESLFNDSELHE